MTDRATYRLSKKMEARLLCVFIIYLYVVWFFVQTVTIENWNGFAIFIYGTPSMLFMWFALQKIRELSPVAIVVLAPIVSGIAEFIHLETAALAGTAKFNWHLENFNIRSYMSTLYRWTYFYLTWYFGFFLIVNYFKFSREAITAADIRAKHNQAEMQTMRYKLNPHFLFNTLNSISTLVLDKRTVEAEHTVENLSRFLRFTIDKTPDVQVTLAEEVDLVKKYIEIETLRFSDKLNVTYEIDPETLDNIVPNLILQSVIEYLINHHVLNATTHQHLIIKTYFSGDMLHVDCRVEGQSMAKFDKHVLEKCAPITARIKESFAGKGSLNTLDSDEGIQGLSLKLPRVAL